MCPDRSLYVDQFMPKVAIFNCQVCSLLALDKLITSCMIIYHYKIYGEPAAHADFNYFYQDY